MRSSYRGTVAQPGSARKADISQLTVIVVDLDEGDITAKRDHLVAHLGGPTMEVGSGGQSSDGQPRRHLYWRLHAPASGDAIATVCEKLVTKLRAERDGILNWALNGCLDWQQQGLAPPEAVKMSTAECFHDEEEIGQWIADSCVAEPKAVTPSGQLFASYRDWAEQTGEEAVSQKAFTQALRSRGQQSKRSRYRSITGLRLAHTPAIKQEE